MSEFKGNKGVWSAREVNSSNGKDVYVVSVDNGDKTITGSSPLKWGNPDIFTISSIDSYVHRGSFEDEEQGTGFSNRREIKHVENALLISKAPELLEILKLILSEQGISDRVHSNLIYNAKRIIKEATELNKQIKYESN